VTLLLYIFPKLGSQNQKGFNPHGCGRPSAGPVYKGNTLTILVTLFNSILVQKQELNCNAPMTQQKIIDEEVINIWI
jgi:hypothetical protein